MKNAFHWSCRIARHNSTVARAKTTSKLPVALTDLNVPVALSDIVSVAELKVELDSESKLRQLWDRGGKTKNNALTPLLASMRKLMDANKGSVCLIQVGSFYELYFEQASLIAPKLGIKVATRKTSNHNVPMAGFPVTQLQKFVKMLVHDLHVNVAIIDQYEAPTDTLMHRKVSRIVSPGTLVDETFMNYSQNNYLVALYIPPNASRLPDPDLAVGILWVDISVGEFYVQQTTLGDLAADLMRISPSEIILLKEWQLENESDLSWLSEMADLRKYFVRYHKTSYKDHKLQFRSDGQTTRKGLEEFSVREEAAMNMVLSYINVNLPDRSLQLDVPTQYYSDRYLHMDSRTREALELTGRAASGTVSVVGSLLNTIKRTVTPSGTRLLTQWVKSPVLDVDELRKRQSFVSLFTNNLALKFGVRSQLSRLGDFIRSLQRLALKNGPTVQHLQAIGEGLTKLNQLREILAENASNMTGKEHRLLLEFVADFHVPYDIAVEIMETLHTDPVPEVATEDEPKILELLEGQLMSSSEDETSVDVYINDPNSETVESGVPLFVFSVKRDHDPRLSELHDELDSLQDQEVQVLDEIREKVAAVDPRASVNKRELFGRWFNVIYITCRLKFSDQIHNVLEPNGGVREKRKTSFIYKPDQWSRLQEQRTNITQSIESLEREIISGLRQKVISQISDIRKVNRLADYLDITSSFAVFAEENDFVCPKFVKAPNLTVSGGRHVVVESSLKTNGQMFNPNDTKLGADGNLWVISGPNMGGKSTYLRQNALIVILAQIGSFVPASKTSMGIVDRIFTRIGASDDIYSDLSTFMVEMIETSNILRNATPRSLAIVDEIGRGTSGKEGLAIAYATLVSLLQSNKCRTLFATHFGHELKNLLETDGVSHSNVRFYKTKVVEDESGKDLPIRFDHSLVPGISDRSYAFEVAKLAGFPQHSLRHADRALGLLNKA